MMSSWSIAERHPIGRMCTADPSHATYRSRLPTLQPNVGSGAGELPDALHTGAIVRIKPADRTGSVGTTRLGYTYYSTRGIAHLVGGPSTSAPWRGQAATVTLPPWR